MSQPLLVRRAAFVMEDPWAVPQGSERIALRRSSDGGKPRQHTTIVVYADDDRLNVLFESEDDEIVATHLRHDAPLYEEDAVEMFLAPSTPLHYFEIEVNPLATTFDAKIDSPDGIRSTMHLDVAWDCTDLFAAVRKTARRVDTIVRVPFASLDVARPRAGDEWRGNFFRIDRSKNRGDEYMAWQPTMKNPADFHVAAAFGRIVFA
jgi:cellulose/xylan binding protein with CBM9 domain